MKSSVLARIGSFFGDISRASAAVRTYERLDALSDQRLAARGINRADLVAAAIDATFGKRR